MLKNFGFASERIPMKLFVTGSVPKIRFEHPSMVQSEKCH